MAINMKFKEFLKIDRKNDFLVLILSLVNLIPFVIASIYNLSYNFSPIETFIGYFLAYIAKLILNFIILFYLSKSIIFIYKKLKPNLIKEKQTAIIFSIFVLWNEFAYHFLRYTFFDIRGFDWMLIIYSLIILGFYIVGLTYSIKLFMKEKSLFTTLLMIIYIIVIIGIFVIPAVKAIITGFVSGFSNIGKVK